MGRPWKHLLRRMGLVGLLALVLALVPCPVWTPGSIVAWQVPVVVLGLVCYLGAALYDTLFYDRYL